MYKYIADSRFVNATTGSIEIISNTVDTSKLFHGDLFVIDESNKCVLTESPTRKNQIPAVLCLRNNRTYGKSGKRHLYKCIPDDKHIAPFLVAYDMKQVGFSKVFVNKYVLIRFLDWTELNPHAELVHVIGNIDILDNYYEYQLHCNGLFDSIQNFSKQFANKLITTIQPIFIPAEIRMSVKAITIDPHGTHDFDDALGIKDLLNGTFMVSVYIANVSAYMDAYDLWDYVERVSTIYLPNKSRTMLAPRLSEHECSLVSGRSRIALTMDVICLNSGNIVNVSFKNTWITVSRNYIYEEPDLLTTREYRDLFELTNKMQTVHDSHELVAFWMGQMNRHIAVKLHDEYQIGIFRRATLTDTDVLPTSIKNWKNAVCDYVVFNKYIENPIHHEGLGVDKYIHITSPIRRLVDLLNMTQFQIQMGVPLSGNANKFYHNWIDRIDYINDRMKAIRQVQTKCSLLAICSLETIECSGFLFDKTVHEEVITFRVYLKSLNLMYKLRTTNDNIQNGDTVNIKVVVFCDEDGLKRKVRLQLKD